MKHQKSTWGFYSEQIADYTSKGLVREDGIPQEGREAELWRMMDPFTYRNAISIPKMMIVGANDRYWAVDAMSLYWNDLQGPTYVHRVPNAGHNLDDGGDGRNQALRTLAVFFRHSVDGKSLPQLTWEFPQGGDALGLKITCTADPTKARLWYCRAKTNDFRESKWQSQDLQAQGGQFAGSVKPEQGEHLALFGKCCLNTRVSHTPSIRSYTGSDPHVTSNEAPRIAGRLVLLGHLPMAGRGRSPALHLSSVARARRTAAGSRGPDAPCSAVESVAISRPA